ncbi:hypothetical protein L3Q82_002895 [Scortum barcoo]|uniref:Uncharacterized protein n=1 Tax=Scortum barcoo TaxID=214431 RepID=A0ACB8VXX5_9TELE|nr:hypothetical protein L3Q82_002895 [Scortum barcoo]
MLVRRSRGEAMMQLLRPLEKKTGSLGRGERSENPFDRWGWYCLYIVRHLLLTQSVCSLRLLLDDLIPLSPKKLLNETIAARHQLPPDCPVPERDVSAASVERTSRSDPGSKLSGSACGNTETSPSCDTESEPAAPTRSTGDYPEDPRLLRPLHSQDSVSVQGRSALGAVVSVLIRQQQVCRELEAGTERRRFSRSSIPGPLQGDGQDVATILHLVHNLIHEEEEEDKPSQHSAEIGED